MKLIGIVGTNSNTSTNRKLLQFMRKHFSSQAEIEVCEIKHLPAFDEPEDRQAPTEVQALCEQIAAADGVIISTPEYDHTIPAALKSAMEWISYTTRPLINKPVLIVGASHGLLGTSRAQMHLRQILDAPELKARVLPSSEFLLGHSLAAFDESGDLVYANKVQELEEIFEEFQLFVKINQQLVKENHFKTEQSKAFSWESVIWGGERA
ncbi:MULTISPECIES: NADPH-dependent FMN reductase [unclassified Paenibacillus]|uniref:NADPH-dependent FMN reductase n=1 Tax=unclassified Paenibacillus TaxID=185978 RepID=UPI0003E272C8|nr:NADPH-dependent FMN reductase family protein [Paenibacillus sp. FSL R7-269]OMF98451.1 NADPH-dependent FMN reductase [Paenibacillus sp. FSL R7-0337]